MPLARLEELCAEAARFAGRDPFALCCAAMMRCSAAISPIRWAGTARRMGWAKTPRIGGSTPISIPPLLRSATVRKHMVGFELLAETQRDLTPEARPSGCARRRSGHERGRSRPRRLCRAFGVEPEGVVFAPGRVNLIGEHVDYNDGLVLPMPISVGTAVAWGRGDGSESKLSRSIWLMRATASSPERLPAPAGDWRSYLRGMAAALAERGLAGRRLRAGDHGHDSARIGPVLLRLALCRGWAGAGGGERATCRQRANLALAAQAAEHEWAGVHCGIMDQMAIAAGEPGCALLLDCRDLATTSALPPTGRC